MVNSQPVVNSNLGVNDERNFGRQTASTNTSGEQIWKPMLVWCYMQAH